VIWRQGLLIASVIFVADVLQSTLLSRLGIPGATPDLLVVSVVALALALGPTQGAVAGFLAGALVDISPPSDTPLGVNSIVYLVVGFATGFVIDPRDRTVWLSMGLVGLSTSGAALATAAIDALLGSPRVIWSEVPGVVVASALYGVLLAPLVVPGVAWLASRVAPVAPAEVRLPPRITDMS
jgi:rod shape-determining protein MreD